MRITFLLPTVGMSGGIKVVGIHAKALAARGHDVTLISPPPKTQSFKKKIKTILLGKSWPKDLPRAPSHLDNSNLHHHILNRWRPITNDDIPDADVVIATWWETAEWVSKLEPRKGAKVYFIQGHELFPNVPIERCRATYKLPLHKIVVANWLKEVMRIEYGDNSVDLVQNSVDQTQFFSSKRKRNSTPTVGLLYSASPVKGLDTAYKALEIVKMRIPKLRIISFGSQPPTQTTPLPSSAEFFLSPNQDEIRNLYSACDVWITASRSEGFNLPAIEAMACRTPIISTRTGWPNEVINQYENGILVDIDDFKGLARGITWIFSRSDDEWLDLSNKAYETATSGSWEKSSEDFELALVRACDRASRGEILGRASFINNSK